MSLATKAIPRNEVTFSPFSRVFEREKLNVRSCKKRPDLSISLILVQKTIVRFFSKARDSNVFGSVVMLWRHKARDSIDVNCTNVSSSLVSWSRFKVTHCKAVRLPKAFGSESPKSPWDVVSWTAMCSSFRHHQKQLLGWLNTVWVECEFVDIMKIRVNLIPFLLKVGNICHFYSIHFSNLSFSPASFSRITYLHISPTCSFHLLADFIYLHLSCFMISVVRVRRHVILTYCFVSILVPQISIFTHNALRSGFTHLQIAPTCRFHLLVDATYLQISSTCTCLVDRCCLYYLIQLENSLVVLLITSYEIV